jgi:hypothetical protein
VRARARPCSVGGLKLAWAFLSSRSCLLGIMLVRRLAALFVAVAGTNEADFAEVGTCALSQSAACPLPTWNPTFNLTESSIMYQPWCINNGGQDCTGRWLCLRRSLLHGVDGTAMQHGLGE